MIIDHQTIDSPNGTASFCSGYSHVGFGFDYFNPSQPNNGTPTRQSKHVVIADALLWSRPNVAKSEESAQQEAHGWT